MILKKGTATVEIVEEISGAYIGQLTAIEGLSWDNFDLKINDFVLIRPSKKHVTLANDPKIILMIEKEDIMARKIGPRNLILDL